MDRDQLQGLQAAILAFLLWGCLTLYWKQLTELDPFEMIGWRVSSAAIIMSVVVTVMGRWKPVVEALTDRALAGRIVLAGVLLVGNWSTYVWAVVNDRLIEAALGYFLAPLGTMALGVFMLGERLTPLKWVSIGGATVAVIVLTWSYGQMPWIALLLAASWSCYSLTKRRVPLGPVESLTSELLVIAVPALAMVASGWFRTSGIPTKAAGADWVLLVGTGVITAIPLLLFAFAAKRVPFTILGPANYLVPLINFLLGWLVYSEALPPSRIVGFALVWVALIVVTIDTVRSHQTTVRPVPIR